MNIEQQYVDLVKSILENGIEKQPTRIENGKTVKVENGTIMIPHVQIQHDMEEGFPLYTHRKLPFRSARVELEGFLNAKTSKKWYQDRSCFFWRNWCNKESTEYKDYLEEGKFEKEAAELTDDLGPLYGYNWRHFGREYTTWGNSYHELFGGVANFPNGLPYGEDQLRNICDTLRKNPYDRRMICSAWNPIQFHLMALIPCHYSWSCCVSGEKLNLKVNIRSNDMCCGNPNNVAFYGVLLLLLCKHTEGYTNLKPGLLTISIDDAHIYHNQIEGAKEILNRELKPLPELELTHSGDLFDWTYKDVKLTGYNPGEKISFGDITV